MGKERRIRGRTDDWSIAFWKKRLDQSVRSCKGPVRTLEEWIQSRATAAFAVVMQECFCLSIVSRIACENVQPSSPKSADFCRVRQLGLSGPVGFRTAVSPR